MTISEDDQGLHVEAFVPAIFADQMIARTFEPGPGFWDSKRSLLPQLTRAQRLRVWRRRSSYAVREWIARLVLPDGPWDDY